MIIDFGSASFTLLNDKALYWESEACLIIADVHLGKGRHFRKNGLPVPAGLGTQVVSRIAELIAANNPLRVIFLGDLFHSSHNADWDELSLLTNTFCELEFILIEGNHDLLAAEHYEAAGIKVVPQLIIHKHILTHHPELHEGMFNICGHIHPAVALSGKGRQSMKLPCYYFSAQQAILPAFGEFTGTFTIQPTKEDRIVVVSKGSLIEIS